MKTAVVVLLAPIVPRLALGYGANNVHPLLPNSDNTRRAVLTRAIQWGTAGATISSSLMNPSLATASTNDYTNNGDLPSPLFLARPMGTDSTTDRPTAPMEYLVPAARVKTYIANAIDVTEEFTRLQTTDETRTIDELTQRMDRLFRTPPSFITSDDPRRKTDKSAASGSFLGDWSVAAQKRKERADLSVSVGLAPRAFEVFELSGERRQWNLLRREEMAKEGASEVRTAFNVYTTNLVFGGGTYELSTSREEKSRLIRDDKLPSVAAVVRSDLDLRDLYRNRVQTALEDAWAEYEYRRKDATDGGGKMLVGQFDAKELTSLLREAEEACRKWFAFVPEESVRMALDRVREEVIQS